jgi:dTDP-glucose 4,6-dehydratase
MKGIDTVVHFAAETHVDRSIIDPRFCKTNVLGTQVLIGCSLKKK